MKKKRTDLPEQADSNASNDDVRFKQQEEFDNKAQSQENNERMIPASKKKENEKWDKVNRKLPYVKK